MLSTVACLLSEEIRVREGQRKPNLMGLLSIVES